MSNPEVTIETIYNPVNQESMESNSNLERSATDTENETNVCEQVKVSPSNYTWNGIRPFAGAVDYYIKNCLNPAIETAKKNLVDNPTWNYATVEIPLFDTIDVPCTDQFGNIKTKSYVVHEAHYGPLIHKQHNQMDQNIPRGHQKWLNFYNRATNIWVILALNQGTKLPGGDGSGRGDTECAPFRDAQIALLKENLFLIDSSDVVYDTNKDRFWYKINIALYRTLPPNGPNRVPHGYGYIPGLGPVVKSILKAPRNAENNSSNVPVVKSILKAPRNAENNSSNVPVVKSILKAPSNNQLNNQPKQSKIQSNSQNAANNSSNGINVKKGFKTNSVRPTKYAKAWKLKESMPEKGSMSEGPENWGWGVPINNTANVSDCVQFDNTNTVSDCVQVDNTNVVPDTNQCSHEGPISSINSDSNNDVVTINKSDPNETEDIYDGLVTD
jgi:hypothetical protein